MRMTTTERPSNYPAAVLLLTLWGAATTALGAEGGLQNVFLDVGLGGAIANSNLRYYNPNGSPDAPTVKSGEGYISLSDLDNDDSVFHGSLALGYNNRDINAILKASYHHFGQVETFGRGDFNGESYEQRMKATASAAFFEFGSAIDLMPAVYLETNGRIGFSMVRSKATQGANLGLSTAFPDNSRTSIAWGLGVGLGYQLFDNTDLLLNIDYFDLGDARTGTTGNPPPTGMNVDERLESTLSFTSTTIGLRRSF